MAPAAAAGSVLDLEVAAATGTHSRDWVIAAIPRRTGRGRRTQGGRLTGSRRKRLGSRWCISRTHWAAAQSSEHSCGSPYKGSRARGMRCRRQVCAGVRARGKMQGFPPTPLCPECDSVKRRRPKPQPASLALRTIATCRRGQGVRGTAQRSGEGAAVSCPRYRDRSRFAVHRTRLAMG